MENEQGLNPEDAVVLEWHYTPTDLFEEPFAIERDDCEIYIADGLIMAIVVPECYDKEHKKRDELHDLVEGHFRAVQVFTHRPFTLPKPTMTRVYPDGRLGTTLLAEPGEHKTTVSCADFVVHDAEGNVVSDTKRERIDAERALGDAIGRLGTDLVLLRVLDSYNAAVTDPADELVHLYEIRDALSQRFGGASDAQAAIGVSKTDWDLFGRLANAEPVQQGRHRGKHAAPLRKATTDELEQARTIARRFIKAYVRYADAAS